MNTNELYDYIKIDLAKKYSPFGDYHIDDAVESGELLIRIITKEQDRPWILERGLDHDKVKKDFVGRVIALGISYMKNDRIIVNKLVKDLRDKKEIV